MLIVEHMSNGRTVVRLHKDWHPGRISRAWMPAPQNNITGGDNYALQTALLGSRAWMPAPQNNITGGDNYALQTALLGSKRSKRNSRSK